MHTHNTFLEARDTLKSVTLYHLQDAGNLPAEATGPFFFSSQ